MNEGKIHPLQSLPALILIVRRLRDGGTVHEGVNVHAALATLDTAVRIEAGNVQKEIAAGAGLEAHLMVRDERTLLISSAASSHSNPNALLLLKR